MLAFSGRTVAEITIYLIITSVNSVRVMNGLNGRITLVHAYLHHIAISEISRGKQ